MQIISLNSAINSLFGIYGKNLDLECAEIFKSYLGEMQNYILR